MASSSSSSAIRPLLLVGVSLLLVLQLAVAACEVGGCNNGVNASIVYTWDWTDNGDGVPGPSEWKNLQPPTQCGGYFQSPVRLTDKVKEAPRRLGLKPLNVQYQGITHLAPPGKTVEIFVGGTFTGGSLGTDVYNIAQTHFHSPAEHIVGPKCAEAADLEMHTVTSKDPASLSVIAVFFKLGYTENPFLKEFIVKNGEGVDLSLIPVPTEYFTYKGSLTTPPCCEYVTWHVQKNKPYSATAEQILWFKNIHNNNARPVQRNFSPKYAFSHA
eukprot:jgi/Chlat1/6148/Chrsp41S05701